MIHTITVAIIATLLLIVTLSAILILLDLLLALIIALQVALRITKQRGEPLQEDAEQTWQHIPLSRVHRQVRRVAWWWLRTMKRK